MIGALPQIPDTFLITPGSRATKAGCLSEVAYEGKPESNLRGCRMLPGNCHGLHRLKNQPCFFFLYYLGPEDRRCLP
jgi:hypothetical protein